MNTLLASVESKRKTAKLLALAVSLTSITVIVGWIFDILFLKSISSNWVSMKFDTAVCFLLSGITLYFIARAREGEFDKAQVVLSITSLIIILLMGILFFSALLEIHTGIEELFVKEASLSAKTLFPGRPSVPTMLDFILIASAGILTVLNPGKVQIKLKVIGYAVGIIGALAVMGYIINVPLLYYFIPNVNTAMACHTAILFVLLGIGLICLSD